MWRSQQFVWLPVQVQQRVYRHHVDRLLADLDTMELHRSTWADAHRIFRSWGRWGHYEGECTAAECRYDILLEDVSTRAQYKVPERLYSLYVRILPVYYWLGGQPSRVTATLVVQDDFVIRKGMYALMEVPPDRKAGDEYGYGLGVAAVSLPRLAYFGEPEAYESNPYFFVTRPDGCEICMDAMLVYSDHAPAVVVRRASALNTACLVGWSGCHTVEDLSPASEPFHLYDDALGAKPAPAQPEPEPAAHQTTVPLWVRGRDASDVLVVEGSAVRMVAGPSWGGADPHSEATVKVLSTWRGRNLTGAPLDVVPYQPVAGGPGLEETIEPGKSYFLLGYERLDLPRDLPAGLRLFRCSVVPKTAATEAELRGGMELDNAVRGGELPHFPF